MSLRALFDSAVTLTEIITRKLDAAGVERPLSSRIADRQQDILISMEGLSSCINKEGFDIMRSYRQGGCSACPVIEAIIDMMCLVLNRGILPHSDLPRKMVWLLVPNKLEQLQKFVSVSADTNYQPSQQIRDALLKFVLRPEHTPEAVEHASTGAEQFLQMVASPTLILTITLTLMLTTTCNNRCGTVLSMVTSSARLLGSIEANLTCIKH